MVNRNVNRKILGPEGRYRIMGTKWVMGKFILCFLQLMSLDFKKT
jgi:hypothetical protein